MDLLSSPLFSPLPAILFHLSCWQATSTSALFLFLLSFLLLWILSYFWACLHGPSSHLHQPSLLFPWEPVVYLKKVWFVQATQSNLTHLFFSASIALSNMFRVAERMNLCPPTLSVRPWWWAEWRKRWEGDLGTESFGCLCSNEPKSALRTGLGIDGNNSKNTILSI